VKELTRIVEIYVSCLLSQSGYIPTIETDKEQGMLRD